MPWPLIPARLEEGGAGLVGAASWVAGEGEELAHRRLLAGHDRCHAGIAGAGRHRRRAEQQRQDHDPGRLAARPRSSDRMAAGDVAELVGDHALHLVGIVGRGEQADCDVDGLAAGGEGVDLADRR